MFVEILHSMYFVPMAHSVASLETHAMTSYIPAKESTWPSVQLGVASQLRQWAMVKAAIQEVALLESNWDGYGARAISNQTINNANYIINKLQYPNLSITPEVSPTSGGTIALSWEYQDIEAYLEIGNTRFSGYVKNENDKPIFMEGEISSFDANLLRPHFVNRHVSAAGTIANIKIQHGFDELVPV